MQKHRFNITQTRVAVIHFAAVVCFLLFVVIGAQGQNYLGAINGEVRDSTGAKLPGAQVTATEGETKFVAATKSSDAGTYSIPSLNPGTYTVTITAAGFRTVTRTDVVLTAGQTQLIDFDLTTGTVNESILVTADTALLDTSSANLSVTMSNKEVTDLPNIGRNPFVLATLAAGVTTGAYMQSKASGFTNPFSGVAVQVITDGNSGHNRLTLNGIPDDPAERLSGASYTGFVPSPEAVQEVKVQTAIFDAQYGHGNGTVTNSVVRTGTNSIHGAAYYVFQNTYLNANTYERVPNQNSTNPLIRTPRGNSQLSQTGLVVDGPVFIPKLYDGRDKTFFMVAFERYQSHVSLPYNSHVPTLAERGGDFSDLCSNFVSGVCASGSGVQLYDPLTADASGNRTPFLNNNITSRINAAGAAIIKYYPAPNASNGNINYISPQTSYPSSYPSFIVRVDQAIGRNNRFNAIFFKSGLTQSYPAEGFTEGIGPATSATGYGYTVYRRNLGGSIDDVQVLSPSMVLDTRIGVLYHPFGLTYPGNINFPLSSIGINGTGLPFQSFPGIQPTDTTTNSDTYSQLAGGAAGQVSENTTGSLDVILTKTLGRHTIRFGFDGNLIRYNVQNPQSGFGNFQFNRQFTQRNSIATPVGTDANSGNPFAALLLGYASSGSYSNQIAFALQQIYTAPFVQDDWRVSNKLTINLGVRWDYESPFTDRYNRLNSSFCTTCANPLQATVPGLQLNGGLNFVNSSNRYVYQKDFNNFQPRVGAAYQLNPNLVARAGFGIIYLNTLETPFAQGFSATTNYVATNDLTHPANVLSNPFPTGVNAPSGSSLGFSTQLGQSVNYTDPNHVQPKSTQYSASIQAQMPGDVVLQVGYLGARPTRLEVNHNINVLPQQYYDLGAGEVTFLNASVPNPLAGKIPNSGLNAGTIARNLLLIPFPEFGSVTENFSSIGSAPYNSLQITVSKPVSHGFSIQGNFTWSKTMLHNSFLNTYQTKLASIQDPNATMVGNLFAIYQFTKLADKPLYVRLPLGGWQTSVVLRAQNGNLISAPGSVNIIGNTRQASPTYGRYFNTCYLNTAGQPVASSASSPGCDALSPTPAYQQRLSYTTQTNSTNLNIRQRVHPLVDFSLFKVFVIREKTNFEIRGEAFNVLNTVNFGGPGTTIGSSTFGVVTLTQANDPRILQLTGRINF
jgi:Carboxypeptidase regulatory-like domain